MKKGVKIAVGVLATVAVLGGAALYLSQTVVKYNTIEGAFPTVNDIMEPYPYTDVEVPDEYRACSIKGIDFEAPDGLYWLYPDETEGVKSGIIVDDDDPDKRSLLICVMDKETESPVDSADLTARGYFDKRMLKGLKKLGYEKPENYHDLVYLTNTFDLKKCNKFSVSEVDAVYNLALLKEIMTPSLIAYNLSDSESEDKEIEAGFYYYDTDTMKSFVMDGMGQNGSYEIQINIFDKNDLDLMQSMFIISDDPQVARQIAKTVAIAED